MKRRDFLSITLPATGAVMIAPGLFNKQAFAEIQQQFSGKADFNEYDLVINGAGLSGYFAAIHAAKQGKKVLLVDKRTSPGYDITAKSRLWLDTNGLSGLRADLVQLLVPEGEKQEIKNTAGTGPGSSVFGDELLLFSGSVRKGLLRNLLVNKVHVLLMTDVCGIFTEGRNVHGVLLASKHGLHAVRCRALVDASDNAMFSRNLLGDKFTIDKAGFVLELRNVEGAAKKNVQVPGSYGLSDNMLKFHRGKVADHQLFIEFEFRVSSQNTDLIEQQARVLSGKLGRDLAKLDASLAKATIMELPLEASLHLANNESLPKSTLKGHYLLPGSIVRSCGEVAQIETEATSFVDKIQYGSTKAKTKTLLTIGAEIPVSEVLQRETTEPGLTIPMREVSFDFQSLVGTKNQSQVLVAGGGTAGSFSAIGAAEKGANTIVVDYFNDLGGTKTMGGVMGYYHGVKDNLFFKKQSEDAERFAFETNTSSKTGRKLYLLQGLLERGGRVLTGIVCHALVTGNKLNGVVICRDGRLVALESQITIDATGDGDIAAFAGAEYEIGNSRTGETQNYSQWDIRGVSPLPSATGRDYDIIDNTKIAELQRGFFISHYEAHFYDFYHFLTVRESRRVTGVYVMNLVDAAENTHYEDVISLASSDFDPHNVGSSEFSKCGFLLPHSNDLTVEVPYRCIVPKRIDGLLISGRGFSQTNNALQFTRMSADLIVLGYLTGHIAADLALKGVEPRNYSISELQKEWAQLGYLPSDYNRKSTWNQRDSYGEIERRVSMLARGHEEYLYECARLSKDKALPVLTNYCNQMESGENKLLLAKAMAWFGNAEGNDLIEQELKEMFESEMKDGYPDGYIDNYDFIRGREKNKLEGLFWRINQNIGLLAMSQDPSASETVKHILENTTSGGGIVERTTEYYNGRIDLKFVPFYHRIMNLCFYAERLPDHRFISGFEKLLRDKNIGGFATHDYTKVRWRVFGGLLEVSIAAAMARCGSKTGYELLVAYLDDTHHSFKTFAVAELSAVTGQNLGINAGAWKKYIGSLTFPGPVRKLVKAVEV